MQFYTDYSLFNYTKNEIFFYILIYVDDLLITSNNAVSTAKFKSYLYSCFHMKDLGSLNISWALKLLAIKRVSILVSGNMP